MRASNSRRELAAVPSTVPRAAGAGHCETTVPCIGVSWNPLTGAWQSMLHIQDVALVGSLSDGVPARSW